MSDVVYRFSEVVESVFLGGGRIQWTEDVAIREVDDPAAPVDFEYQKVTDYYSPDSVLTITVPEGGSIDAPAEAVVDGGFNEGDQLQLTVTLEETATGVTATMHSVSDPIQSLGQLADVINMDVDGVSAMVVTIAETDRVHVYPEDGAYTVTLSAAGVMRADIDLPEEVEAFLNAVSSLG